MNDWNYLAVIGLVYVIALNLEESSKNVYSSVKTCKVNISNTVLQLNDTDYNKFVR